MESIFIGSELQGFLINLRKKVGEKANEMPVIFGVAICDYEDEILVDQKGEDAITHFRPLPMRGRQKCKLRSKYKHPKPTKIFIHSTIFVNHGVSLGCFLQNFIIFAIKKLKKVQLKLKCFKIFLRSYHYF
jgi:hypothetical protein